jgi:hypothetical protein
MDPIELVQTKYFWCAFGIAAAVLVVLRILAGREADRRYGYDPCNRRDYLRPPGVFGISVAGERIVLEGQPRARFINPVAYVFYVCLEPTLLVWYVAGWFVLFQDWRHASNWIEAGFVWRFTWDLLLHSSRGVSLSGQILRLTAKCLWALASGIFYAAVSVGAIALLLMLLVVFVFLLSGGSGGRKRRRF